MEMTAGDARSHRTARFLWHVCNGRWMVIAVAFYILSFSGATYIFGIYSGAIKSALDYDQQTIDTLSFFKDLGSNVGIVSGLMNEVAPTWSVLALGAGMNVFGYLMVWLAITRRIGAPSPSLMYLYMCIGANSQTFANTGVLVTCVKNFPHSRGVVLGLVKGCVGLSGAIFTQMYHAVYGHDSRGLVLLIAVLPSIVTLLFMFFVRPMPPPLAADKGQVDKHFFAFLYLALALASFLMAVIIVESLFPIASVAYKAIGAVTLLLVAANVLVAVRAERDGGGSIVAEEAQGIRRSGSSSSTTTASTLRVLEIEVPPAAPIRDGDPTGSKDGDTPAPATTPTTTRSRPPPQAAPRDGDDDDTNKTKKTRKNQKIEVEKLDGKSWRLDLRRLLYADEWPQRGEDFTIAQAILSADMWILFAAITCGVGATLTAIDNMGQIGAALGYSGASVSTCVSLISIWNFLGRVLAGFASEHLLRRYAFPRTLVLTIVLALACVGHLLIAFPGPGALYAASVVVGLCFGAQWPLLFAVISELFGLKYYATLYNVGAVASPLGSYLLNVKVAGHFYDMEARRQAAPGPALARNDLVCSGPRCFRLTFLIMTLVSAVGSFISFLLVLRTRKFYAQDLYAKFDNVVDVRATDHLHRQDQLPHRPPAPQPPPAATTATAAATQ